MIEKELKFIADFTLNKVKDLGQFFTYRKLLNADIHPAILKYISADVDFRIYEDRKKLLQESDFDYSGFEISKYFDLISQQIKKKTKIDYNAVKSLVIEAITFNAEYTIKPNSTIKKFIFNNKNKVSADELKMRLDSLYYYSYFSEVLNAFINKNKVLSIRSKEFENIIKKLDHSLVEKESVLIEYALNSIADFYNIGSMDKSKIQVNLVENFLIDKELDDFLEKLDYSYQKQSKQTHAINDFLKVLFSDPIEKQIPKKQEPASEEDELIEFEEETPSKQPEEKISSEHRDEEENKKEKAEEDTKLEPSEQENLDPLYNFDEDKEFIEDKAKHNEPDSKKLIDKEIEKSDEFEVTHKEKAPVKDKRPEDISFSDEISDEIIDKEFGESKDSEPPKEKKSKIFELSADKEAQQHEKTEEKNIEFKHVEKKTTERDLFSYLSNKEIEKIVASVFNDDREDFATVIEKISESDSYENATEILKKIFKSYNVNPYSRDAVTLTNCISNYFEQN